MKTPARAVDGTRSVREGLPLRSILLAYGARARAHLELTKPRLTSLAVVATGVGYSMGARGALDWSALVITMIGATLVGGGANALNQFLERDLDARMRRTMGRPLPSRRLEPIDALIFGLALSFPGVILLGATRGLAPAAAALMTLISYLLIYTPMKRRSEWNTAVGAVPGALPVLIGWTASGAELTSRAWSLFFIVVLWQIPHFFAICWKYRDDYRRAGYKMFPLKDEEGRATGLQAACFCMVLIPLTWAPTWLGLTGFMYAIGATGLGIGFLGSAAHMARRPSQQSARTAFLASILYLPLLMGLMMMDKAG